MPGRPTALLDSQRGTWRSAEHHILALGSDWYRLLAILHANVYQATADFWRDKGALSLPYPATTANVSSPLEMGSDSRPVKVRVEGISTYLADSMQFLLEYGCRLTASKCFSFMPSYRGEAPDETHLSQFYNSEVEIPGEFDDAVSLAEEYLRFLCKHVFSGCDDLAFGLVGDLSHVKQMAQSRGPLPRVTLDEAVQLLGKDYVKTNRRHGFRRVTRAGEERLIGEFGGAVWLTEHDHRSVPFYQAFLGGSQLRARVADLLMGLGEVIGLGQRHRSAKDIRLALGLHQLGSKADQYEWYLRMRELHPMVTSGFGLGVERFLCWATRHSDIRDCQLFLRFRGLAPVV